MIGRYDCIWILLAQIAPKEGYTFDELVDSADIIDETEGDNSPNQLMAGAWANIVAKATDIRVAMDIVDRGCEELGFYVNYIDKIENVASLVSDDELDPDVRKEVDWLINSKYCFKITGRIFPFAKDEMKIR